MSLANRKRDLDTMNGQQKEAASQDGRQGRYLPQLEQRSINIESRQLPGFLATPPQVPSPRRGSPNNFATNDFTPDASIVFLGARGTRKSTLAVIAATVLQREQIDADSYFQQHTGHSRSEFKKRRGIAEYSTSEESVMRKMLSEHSRNSVIICNPGCVERSGQLLLKEYATSHPVIHVVRDPKSVQKYLKAWDEAKIMRLLEVSEPIYR
jgi:shikimate kinase